MKNKGKSLLAFVASLCLLATPLTALAANVDYTAIDYTAALTVGTAATGTISNSPDTDCITGVIPPDCWADKGYTVALEADKKYRFTLTVTAQTDISVGAFLLVLTGDTLQGTLPEDVQEGNANGDITSCTVTVNFTPQKSGSYRVLPLSFFEDNNADSTKTVSYSLSVAEHGVITDERSISNKDELLAFAEAANDDPYAFVDIRMNLMADIDMSGTDWTTIEELFEGEFNGNGHTITGLNAPFIEEAEMYTITGLTLADVDITLESADNEDNFYDIGALVCYSNDGLVVTDCHVTGSITVTVASYVEDVGGMIGYIEDGAFFRDCTADVAVSVIDTNTENGTNYYIGGFVGCVEGDEDNPNYFDHCKAFGDVTAPEAEDVGGFGGRIDEYNVLTNCGAEGDVSGDDYVGGFAGISCCTNNRFLNCYALGNVTGDYDIGGFVGDIDYPDNVFSNCYAAGTVTAANEEDSECLGAFSGTFYEDGEDETTLFNNCFALTQDDLPLVGELDPEDVEGIAGVNFVNADERAAMVAALNEGLKALTEDYADNLTAFGKEFAFYRWANLLADGAPTFADLTVVFVDANGETVATLTGVAPGEDITAKLPTAPDREGYRFVRWDGEFTSVKASMTVQPVYELLPPTTQPTTPPSEEVPATGASAAPIALCALLTLGAAAVILSQKKQKTR